LFLVILASPLPSAISSDCRNKSCGISRWKEFSTSQQRLQPTLEEQF
jgi:hypothetical protein